MNRLVRLFVVLALVAVASYAQAETDAIAVSANHHYLQHKDGRPFFWQGDTAWLLLSKLDRADTLRYLDDRQAKGFNVLQVMVLHGREMNNAYGVPALVANDPARPNLTPGNDPAKPGEYDYWDNLDWVLDEASARGIYLALVPVWGGEVDSGTVNANNVQAYGKFLATRYRSKTNIFWVVGGDTHGNQHSGVWNALGRTLKANDPNHLITFHPFGRTQSSMWFHNEAWLDFNMFQSGHRNYAQDTDSPHKWGEDNWRYVMDDWQRTPTKPVIDGEPSYEDIPQGLHDVKQKLWTAGDARRYAYWSVFAGAFGHTFGNNAIMQFHKPGEKGAYGSQDAWFDAIQHPGSSQMIHLQKLILSRPYFERVADESVVVGNGERYDYVAVTRGASYLFAYTYSGKPMHLRLGVLTGKKLKVWWYDPRTGAAQAAGTVANAGEHTFTPPDTKAAVNDWVLVLDDAGKRFAAPGQGPAKESAR